jgi:hypothetical protein
MHDSINNCNTNIYIEVDSSHYKVLQRPLRVLVQKLSYTGHILDVKCEPIRDLIASIWDIATDKKGNLQACRVVYQIFLRYRFLGEGQGKKQTFENQ